MGFEERSISASARADAPISSAELIGVTTFYITVCTVFTFARMCTRYFIHQQLWWDDWTMFLSWLGTITLCSLQLVMMRFGAGVNVWEVPEDDLKQFLKLFLDIQMVARVSIFFARLSILLLYVRLFFPLGTARSPFWWVIQAVIALNFLYTVSLVLVTTLQCVPRGLPWGSSCVDQWLVLVMASVINIASDLAVLAIPVAAILRLQTTRRRKWAIWALFAFGALAPLASIARLGYQIPVAGGTDKTVIYPIVLILATAEQAVAMIVGSAPVAGSAVFRLLRRRRRHSDSPGLPAGQINKSMSKRMWPGREARSREVPKDSRGVPDPYPITGATLTASEEVLYPQPVAGQSDDYRDHDHDHDHGESWEMMSKTTSSMNKVSSYGGSTIQTSMGRDTPI